MLLIENLALTINQNKKIITKIGTRYFYLESFIQDDIKVSLKSKERNKMKTI
jgi:hypothetical protein